jgi:ubiquitin carboxyl-terminal hydrolase 4/11/15
MNQYYYQQTKSLESMLGDRIEFGRTNASLIVDVAPSVVKHYKKRHEDEEKRTERASGSPKSSKHCATLTDCFTHLTKSEILSNDDLWYCPKCKELQRASKKIDLWLLPKVLILELIRFNDAKPSRAKDDSFIDCPLRDLDLSEFVINPAEKSKAKYDLIAVTNHMSDQDGPHYTAHAKNIHDQKWHTFDDSNVGEINENSVISKAAYVLIYQQKE